MFSVLVRIPGRRSFTRTLASTVLLEFARECGVKRLVFDNLAELDKIASIYPDAEITLRVQADDCLAKCPLSNKCEVPVDGAGALLGKAVALGLKVVGVSFHFGSGCSQTGAFRSALQRAKAVFDEASRQGLSLTLLDIGGGFPGWDEDGEATFANHANDITPLLEELFPSPSIQVIVEPGRFFCSHHAVPRDNGDCSCRLSTVSALLSE